tara:strand:+ start:1553 stop:1696 length:144 start_codon:yes stop_codon:yes gene_type:complete
MDLSVTGRDLFGLSKRRSVKILLINISDLILKVKMDANIGFMDLLLI